MCQTCRSYPCVPGCPNYTPPDAKYCCSVCEEGIYDEEEYIENNSGERMHYECIQGFSELLEFLGYDIKYLSDDHEYIKK